jgi:hypothetical protein
VKNAFAPTETPRAVEVEVTRRYIAFLIVAGMDLSG